MNVTIKRRVQRLEEVAREKRLASSGIAIGPGLDGLSDEQLEHLISDLECGRDISPTLFAGIDIEAIAPGATEKDLDTLVSNLRIAISTLIH